jgi:hypothetical protein
MINPLNIGKSPQTAAMYALMGLDLGAGITRSRIKSMPDIDFGSPTMGKQLKVRRQNEPTLLEYNQPRLKGEFLSGDFSKYVIKEKVPSGVMVQRIGGNGIKGMLVSVGDKSYTNIMRRVGNREYSLFTEAEGKTAKVSVLNQKGKLLFKESGKKAADMFGFTEKVESGRFASDVQNTELGRLRKKEVRIFDQDIVSFSKTMKAEANKKGAAIQTIGTKNLLSVVKTPEIRDFKSFWFEAEKKVIKSVSPSRSLDIIIPEQEFVKYKNLDKGTFSSTMDYYNGKGLKESFNIYELTERRATFLSLQSYDFEKKSIAIVVLYSSLYCFFIN